MSRCDFPINDDVIVVMKEYLRLRKKRMSKLDAKEIGKDEYILRITRNVFRLISENLDKRFLKNGLIDHTQFQWIKSITNGTNKYIKYSYRHGKAYQVYHKMETPQTIQGKYGSPEYISFLEAKQNVEIPVFNSVGIEKELTKEVEPFELEIDWSVEKELEITLAKSQTMAEYQIERRRKLDELNRIKKGT